MSTPEGGGTPNPWPRPRDITGEIDPRQLTECADTVLFAIFAASECHTCPHHWNEDTLRCAERMLPDGMAPEKLPRRVHEFTDDERAAAARFLMRLGCIAWNGK
jgi:hypothetical protein